MTQQRAGAMQHGAVSLRALAAVMAVTLCLAHTASANWPHNPAVNVPVSKPGGNQRFAGNVPDGNGGAIVVWWDMRDTLTKGVDVYAEHVISSGQVDASWPVDGLPVCSVTGDQRAHLLVSDGAGGVIVEWDDLRNGAYNAAYAQHVLGSGSVDPNWPVNGRALTNATFNQSATGICSDGAGGAIVCWRLDVSSSNNHIYAQHVLASGVIDPSWPPGGRAVCTAANHRQIPFAVADGSGGAIVVWFDARNPLDSNIYAQHVLASGAIDGAWTVDGVPLTTAPGSDNYFYFGQLAVTDGAGGAIVTWTHANGIDGDVYAQRIRASGVVDPGWPPNGRLMCPALGNQDESGLISDGYGGAIVTWGDTRAGTRQAYAQHVLASGLLDAAWPPNGTLLSPVHDLGSGEAASIATDGAGGAIVSWSDHSEIFAQRVTAGGAIPVTWPVNGRIVCNAVGGHDEPAICSDGGGHAIVTWEDLRSGTDWDIYAQRIDPTSYLGNPNPNFVSVFDMPMDQGGLAQLTWDPSYLDSEEPFVVDHYWVMREQRSITGALYWQPLERIDARHLPDAYHLVEPTLADSSAAGNPLTRFMVVADDPAESLVLPSDPVSGYSVDNLAPQAPGNFTGDDLPGGGSRLHWNPSPEPDFARYRVYRGPSASFTPDPTNRIAETADTSLIVADPPGSFYKLSAVDVHDNEGPYASFGPPTDGVGGGQAVSLSLRPPTPNPTFGNARIGFALPHASRVRVAIYDVAGRLQRTLVEGVLAAGEHAEDWDLRDGSGRTVPAGLYFVRLDAERLSLTRRLAVATR